MFGSGRGGFDPTSQTEGIGNDPVKASEYGMKNLKYVAAHLMDWTTTEGENYADLEELYGEMLGVWSRYTGHVVTNVGGIVETRKTAEQEGLVYQPLSAEEQQRAVKFLLEESFSDPSWMVNSDMVRRMQAEGILERIQSLQSRHLTSLLSVSRLNRMVEIEFLDGISYGADDMMQDVQRGIWSELKTSTSISPYRRNLQRAYVDHLSELAYSESNDRRGPSAADTDAQAIARASLDQLKKDIQVGKARMKDAMTIYHLNDIISRIDDLQEGR
jgi:hypothetical protein